MNLDFTLNQVSLASEVGPLYMPKVSVIIPAFNRAQYISKALESVLAQTYGNYEIVVVDDGSTDATVAALEPYRERISYIYQPNRGVSAARNTGIAASCGEFLAFLDSDDLFLSDKLAAQVAFLDGNSQVDLVASGWTHIDQEGAPLDRAEPWLHSERLDLATLLTSCPFILQSSLVRREWLEQVRGFDEELRRAEDWDLFLRLAHEGCQMAWLRQPVCLYRIHPNSLSNAITLHKQSHFLVLDKYFANLPMDDPLHGQRLRLYATTHLQFIGRELGAGNVDEARAGLEKAVEYDPTLVDSNDERILWALATVGTYTSDPDAFLDMAFESLQDTALPSLADKPKAKAMVRMHYFYKAYREGNWPVARRRFPAAVVHDPKWLMNRGAVRMWLDTVIGHERVDRLRQLLPATARAQ